MKVYQPGERVLNRSVYKHIKKMAEDSVKETGGMDYACAGGIVTAAETDADASVAYVRAGNRFRCSLAEPAGFRVQLLLPEGAEAEARMKKMMACLNGHAAADGLQLAAADVRLFSVEEASGSCAVSRPGQGVEASESSEAARRIPALCTVTLFGHRAPAPAAPIPPGGELVMVGYAGLLGTRQICKRCANRLRGRYGEDYLAGVLEKTACFDNRQPVLAAKDALFVKNIGTGGIFGALWQLSESFSCGVVADWKKIPILQETVELSDHLRINPYELMGDGAILCVTADGAAFAETLEKRLPPGVPVSVIGRLTEGRDRRVSGQRHLTMVEGDALDCLSDQ